MSAFLGLWSWLAGSRVGRAVSALLAVAGAAFGLYLKGRSDARAKADAEKAKDYVDTRKRIDEADVPGNDPDAARRWLHERGKSDRDL